jgi:hypothetical protein
MGKYSYYDEKEGVIFTNLAGLESTREITDAVINEVIAIARSLPQKVFVVVNWQGARINDPEYYGQRVAELMQYIRGVVRYSATDVHTRIAIRTQTIKRHLQASRSHIFNSKEEALAAIRSGLLD